jgi:hypothetical protein
VHSAANPGRNSRWYRCPIQNDNPSPVIAPTVAVTSRSPQCSRASDIFLASAHHGGVGVGPGSLGPCLSRQKNGAITAIRTSTAKVRKSADCSSHAIPRTPTPITRPTRQMRHAEIWTPAVKVPSASNVSAARALASAFIILATSATDMRCIARSTAVQCKACVHTRRKRSSRLWVSRHRVMTQIAPIKGARTIQLGRHSCVREAAVGNAEQSQHQYKKIWPFINQEGAWAEIRSSRWGVVRLRFSHYSSSLTVRPSVDHSHCADREGTGYDRAGPRNRCRSWSGAVLRGRMFGLGGGILALHCDAPAGHRQPVRECLWHISGPLSVHNLAAIHPARCRVVRYCKGRDCIHRYAHPELGYLYRHVPCSHR